ncbi:MAG TPA: FtsX-like permease family protein, partial [Planctomycetota bacterium]|nr:FtsX-like permease family protein [Planctomycetota bacterium]
LLLWPLRRLFPLAVFLLRTVLQRGAGRLAAAVCGLAAVLLALLGLKSLTASLRAEVRAFAAEALEGRVFLEGPAVTPAVAMALAALPGVAAVEPQAGLAPVGFLPGGLALESAAAAGGALEQHRDAAGRYASRERRTLVASQRLAAKMGWRPGSLVPLADRNGMPVSYEVLLVSDRSGYQPSERAWAITSPYWLQHDFCIPPACVGRITLRLQPGADPGVVLARADQALPGRTGKRRGDYIREFHLFDVTRDFMLFDLLLLLILLLAGIGLVNGMTIAALGRIREFGVLRALGVGAATLRGIFLLEGALVALLAAGMALLLCLPMAKLLIAGLNKVAGLHAPVELPVKWMWATPGIALLVGLLAAVLPGLRAVAQSPATSVRCE